MWPVLLAAARAVLNDLHRFPTLAPSVPVALDPVAPAARAVLNDLHRFPTLLLQFRLLWIPLPRLPGQFSMTSIAFRHLLLQFRLLWIPLPRRIRANRSTVLSATTCVVPTERRCITT
jgi:hypothetical protein